MTSLMTTCDMSVKIRKPQRGAEGGDAGLQEGAKRFPKRYNTSSEAFCVATCARWHIGSWGGRLQRSPGQQELANLKITFFLRPKSAAAESWHASGARRAVAARCSGLSRRAAAAESAQTAGGAGAVLRPERAENRLPALPKRGPWRAERRMGRPHMSLARGHGREPALAAIACEKSDLVHVPPGLVHVRGGVKKSIFFYELVPPGRIEGITGDPRRVLPPPVPSEGGVPKSASSGHVAPSPTTRAS